MIKTINRESYVNLSFPIESRLTAVVRTAGLSGPTVPLFQKEN